MNAWLIVLGAFGTGSFLLGWGARRARARHLLEEASPVCPIAELEPGRFRVVGRVVPIETTPSLVDGADCVYVESAEYRTVGKGLVPLLREVHHGAVCKPFYLEDDTGRILVDPARALIDCATVTADGGLTSERRLRAGEEVSLLATFRAADVDDEVSCSEGPYRTGARRWRPAADGSGPPRLSHRTEDGMITPPPDDVCGFLSGAGAMILTMGALLAFVVAFLV